MLAGRRLRPRRLRIVAASALSDPLMPQTAPVTGPLQTAAGFPWVHGQGEFKCISFHPQMSPKDV